MTSVNSYLNFNGNCEEAFNHYKSVFGGDFSFVGRYKDMPPQEGMPPMPSDVGERIMHMALPISKETMLMGSDAGGDWAPNIVQGNNVAISINTDSKESADKLFNGLSDGGSVTMPMNDTFWGDYFGMFTDKFGINWMVSYSANQPPKD
ncbi:MAG TPA: VOC family protein [Saprospiraceae bacterium]|nr:VOC family protein [Saprospiraceae bacterium]